MPATYEPIATNTLTTNTATVTFSSISASYTDLVLVSNVGATAAGASVFIRFNSDTGTNYSYTEMYGDGTTAASARASSLGYSQPSAYIGVDTPITTVIITNIQNYSNTTTNKTFLSRANRASAGSAPGTEALVGLWRSTAAINTIALSLFSGSFVTGSTFTLYGIKAA